MRPEGVAAAERELKRAIRASVRVIVTSSFEDAEDAWVDFLTHAGRLNEKLRAACHGQGVDWMWWKKKMDQRRDDPLLLYVHKARNADTHRLEDIVERVRDGRHKFQLPNYGTVVYDGPNHLRPLTVRDKQGNTYDPPLWHKGRFHGYLTADMIAWLAHTHLQGLVSEASSRLR